ncbi:MAG: hypothetical protein KAR19_04630 [Bacteroidales bacterium]|nr:hypothetical protein [Bacteroidales bacterium]
MKKRVYKSKSLLLSLLLIVVVSFTLTAQDARKEYSETYDINKGVTLSTETKYSDIELLTWDKNVLDILVEVKVDASSKSKAEETLKKIQISIQKSGNTISLETKMDQGWSRNVKTEISITIKAPAYINLNMENSYGDLFIQEVSGLALLDLKYSNIKAGKLSRGNEKPYNQIDLAYSNGTIDEAGWIEMELAYSDMEINSSQMLFVESKYSKMTGESAGGIITEGAYNKYFFDEIDSFIAELKYSGLKFGVLNKKLDLQSTYTNAKVLKLSKDFEKVDASLSYGNIFMDVESGASFKFEGESKYGKINVAPEGKLSKSKEGISMKIWGTVGSSPKSTMHLITRYGNIDIE